MPRDNRCMYMTHVCYNSCSSECEGMFVLFQPLLKIVGFSPGVLEVCCVFV